MTETISAPDTQAAASLHLPRPRTDADALRAIEDCVDEILAKAAAAAAAG